MGLQMKKLITNFAGKNFRHCLWLVYFFVSSSALAAPVIGIGSMYDVLKPDSRA